jgi:Uma2 family endonuclease
MGMPATSTDWTVSMLDALPDDGQRYEVIDGALQVTPSPGVPHQEIVGELYALLREYLRAGIIGKVMSAPTDVRVADYTRNRVQPDVFVVRRVDGQRPPYPYDLRDLLLAVEVVSPGSVMRDHQLKRTLYLRSGVGEYWVIDPDAQHITRWRDDDQPGAVFSQTMEWAPSGISAPFVLDIPKFFEDARA